MGMMDMMKMLGKVTELKDKMKQAQDNLAQLSHSAADPSGQVTATVNGQRQLLSLIIAPALLAQGDSAALEKLIVETTNKALNEVEALAKEEIKRQTEGVLPNIPGLDLASLLGK
jgi:nucleoid-associated protein EbfC